MDAVSSFWGGTALGNGVTEFEEFVREHERWLARLCWLLTLDITDADDAVQETFGRWWRDRHRLESHPNQRAWLRRVAVNICRDRARRRTTRDRHAHLLNPPSEVAEAPLEADLHRAIAALPLRQRQVIVLRYWSDLDLRSCADAMNVSLGSAKKHLARAHAALAGSPHLAIEGAP